jgi:hypothetical protein
MSKDLKKYKKIKCDLEMSYAGPYRAIGGKLLAMDSNTSIARNASRYLHTEK